PAAQPIVNPPANATAATTPATSSALARVPASITRETHERTVSLQIRGPSRREKGRSGRRSRRRFVVYWRSMALRDQLPIAAADVGDAPASEVAGDGRRDAAAAAFG